MVTYKEVLQFLGYSFNIKYVKKYDEQKFRREGYGNEG